MVTVLAVADTDSYLKWSVATLARLRLGAAEPGRSVQVVLDNPVMPSADQRAAAGAGDAAVLDHVALARLVRTLRPDVVLLACTGPVVAALLDARWVSRPDRPVLVTGLPGISIPPTRRALQLRVGCDLFLLHSRREVVAFTALAASVGAPMRFGLARLPFLGPVRAQTPAPEGDLVFAAQAKVPVERDDRERVLLALAQAGGAVVKLRAAGQEQQTHHEALPYPTLYADLVAQGRVAPGSITFTSGSMRDALDRARALVTVSSTAALEAMADGVPVLLVDDFGVSETMINVVFEGSGCFGSLADLQHGASYSPDGSWLDDNYFHPAAADDGETRLAQLVADRAAGRLPRLISRPQPPGRWRRRVRLSRVVLALRRVGRRARGRTALAPPPVHRGH